LKAPANVVKRRKRVGQGAAIARGKIKRARSSGAGADLQAAVDRLRDWGRHRVEAELDKANVERARGNEYGYEYHRARAADLAALPSPSGAPGSLARAAESGMQLRRARAKAGAKTGAAMKLAAEITKQKVMAAAAAASADGVQPRKLTSEVCKRTGLARSTVVPYLPKKN
jgi:hypothetical protein